MSNACCLHFPWLVDGADLAGREAANVSVRARMHASPKAEPANACSKRLHGWGNEGEVPSAVRANRLEALVLVGGAVRLRLSVDILASPDA